MSEAAAVVAMAPAATVVVVVVEFDFAGGARAWTRQSLRYLPCGEAVCIVCREFAACVPASLTFFAKNRSKYTLYTCAPKGYKNCACSKTKGNTFNY